MTWDSSTTAGIVLTLVLSGLWGFVYNSIVARIEDEWAEGANTADLVIVGVAVVLLLSVLILGVWNVLYLFGMFGAAGIFMAGGSKVRYNKRRREADRRLRDQINGMVQNALEEGGQGSEP